MTSSHAQPGYPSPGSAGVWMMALALTFTSGGVGYSLGPMIEAVTSATGWTKPQVALGSMLSMLTAILASPHIGRMVDRGKGVEAVCASALWGGLMLLLVSRSQSLWQWYLTWALAGPGFAGALYEPSFAFFARRLGPNARGAMIRMTLVAGFTSTFAFLYGGALNSLVGWRGSYVGFGLLCIFGSTPLYWVGGNLLRRGERPPIKGAAPERGVIHEAVRRWRFWVLGGIIGLISLNHSMMNTLALPLFTSLGASTALATAFAASMGPFQVLGRLGLMIGGGAIRPRVMHMVMIAMMIGGILCLLAAQAQLWLILGFTALQGSSVGIISILRPMLTAEVMGTRGFGTISGTLVIASLTASAVAPVLAASIFEFGGPLAMLMICLCVLGLAMGLCLILPRRSPAGSL